MTLLQRFNRFLSGLYGCSGICLAALAAHLPDNLLQFNGKSLLSSASQILLWHALALLFLSSRRSLGSNYISALMILGTFFFSASLILHAFEGIRLSYLAPVGGGLLIISWLWLGLSAFCQEKREDQDIA